ncbi:hypothetical protein OK016_08280 [Vibrio chagasii]|nr:hypothetical protein [Vibrio chagasii]
MASDTNVEDLIDYNYATSKYYNTDGESQLRGVEMIVGFDTGFINQQHQITALTFKTKKINLV